MALNGRRQATLDMSLPENRLVALGNVSVTINGLHVVSAQAATMDLNSRRYVWRQVATAPWAVDGPHMLAQALLDAAAENLADVVNMSR